MVNNARWRVTALAVCLACSATAFAQANGVTVLDSLNPRHGGPGPSFGFYYASCWGYVAPDGHEYALLGCYSGTSIIDLDATPIREVAYIPGANNEWKEIKVWGQYAYAVSESPSQGLQIIDLSKLPDSARLVRSVTNVGGRNVANSHTVTVADGFLYLNGGSSNGTAILDLTDPVFPTLAGHYNPAYFHDTYVRNDTLIGAALGGGVYITSVTNKASPELLGRITYTGSGTHNAWTSIDGKYIFTTDEVGSTQKNMKVWDISNLPTVVQRSPVTFSPTRIIHNVHGRGYYVYVAHYQAGTYVADVHDPLNIVTVGSYGTYRGGGTNPSYAGAWGVYPYYPSGRFIASDTQTGLYLMRFDGMPPRTRSQLLAPANNDTLHQGTPKTFRWRFAANQAEDPHSYGLHIFGPGVDTILATRDSSLAVSAVPGMQNGQTYHWHIWIKDEFTRVSSADTLQFVFKSAASSSGSGPGLPAEFRLEQNYPNPFNPATRIEYALPQATYVDLSVFNLLGERVATLVDEVQSAGRKVVQFSAHGADSRGNPVALPSGVYLYRLTTGSFVQTKKMVLIQ